jgi:Flp pilus assembly protein TadG
VRTSRQPRERDGGAAVVEFVMISVLLIFLLFAVLQVAVLFYVRNLVAASAADGAHYAASSNVPISAGAARANSRMASSLTGSVVRDIRCTATTGVDQPSGLPTTVVRCEGRIKSIFLPFAAFVHLDVTARVLTESPS